jgi:hypothetical protein
MKLTSILLLASLAGGLAAPSVAQQRRGTDGTQATRGQQGRQDRQRAQEARGQDHKKKAKRTDEARKKKQDVDGRRAKAARDAKQQQNARRTEAARDAKKAGQQTGGARRGAEKPKPGIGPKRVGVKRAPDKRAIGAGTTGTTGGTTGTTGDEARTKAARDKALSNQERRANAARDAANKKATENSTGDAGRRAAKARSDQQRTAAARETSAKRNQVVNDMTRRVRDHRVRMAEIARLEKLYADKGDRDKVARVQAISKKENDNYSATMKRYEQLLGKDDFNRVRGRLKVGDK